MDGQEESLIVRFAEAVPLDERTRYQLAVQAATGLSPRISWDLGHRGPDDEVALTIAVVTTVGVADDDERMAALEAALGKLLLSGGEVLIQLVNRTTGRHVTVEDTSDNSFAAARDAVVRWRGEGSREIRADPVTTDCPLTFLVLCDEWFPAEGGISAFNRYLCRALAAAGHRVLCLLPSWSSAELADAEAADVRLVEARQSTGASASEVLMRKPELPDGAVPDVVIGHSRITGLAAQVLVESHYDKAARLHFVHMHPDQIEWGKLDTKDAALTTEERTRQERELCANATRVIAVGPRLYDYAISKLVHLPGAPDAVQLIPGFDDPGTVGIERPRRRGTPITMVLGRVADVHNKGVDLAAKAIGSAINELAVSERDLSLLVRGVPAGEGKELRDKILGWAGVPGLEVDIRNYTPDPAYVTADLGTASLLLMASREEGFGLVGWEAIRLGVPLLVSDRSGLGEFLLRSELPPELKRNVVLPVKKDDEVDARVWASHLKSVLFNREAAFDTAWSVRAHLAERHTWAAAVQVVETALQRR